MRKSILATAVAGAFIWAGVASAGPLAPSLSINAAGDFSGPDARLCGVFSCIAGEGAAVNSLIGKANPLAALTGQPAIVPDTAIQHMDWIVIHTPGFGVAGKSDDYLYLYQIENSSIAALVGATIATNQPGQTFVGAFFGGLLDLDLANALSTVAHASPVGATPGQVAGPFDNLAVPRTSLLVGPQIDPGKREFELPAQIAVEDPIVAFVDVNGDLAAAFLGLEVGEESGIYGARGSRPVYGPWNTQGAAFTWNSEQLNPCTGPVGGVCEQGIRVPVPGVVPEPASLLLLASGLLGLGAWTRRRRQS